MSPHTQRSGGVSVPGNTDVTQNTDVPPNVSGHGPRLVSIGHDPWPSPGVLVDNRVYRANGGRIIKDPLRVCKRLTDLGPAPDEVTNALGTYLAIRATKHDDWKPLAHAEEALDRALVFAHYRTTHLLGPQVAPV